MEKIKISEIRAKFPMYGDVSDQQLLTAVRKRYYDDIPAGQFISAIDFDTERERIQKEMLDSMSGSEKFFAGMGKSAMDLWRTGKRVANMAGVGDYDQAAAQRDKEIDAPLMSTGAGTAGAIAGDLMLTAVPGYKAQQAISRGATTAARVLPRAAAAATRGAAPYIGAAGSGALIGAATNPADMSGGAATGAAAGAAGEVAGRVLSSVYSGAKGALDPLTEQGRKRVLKRTFDRFATNPQAAMAAADNPQVLVPGSMPTLAEATMDPGLAQLQRGAAASSPDVASALAQSRNQQVAAYRAALDDLAGNDGRRAALDTAREAAADRLYGQARTEGLQMTDDLTARVQQLMQKPSVQSAVEQAKVLARERGININDPAGSVAGLHYVKQALDDQIGAAVRAGNNNLAGSLRQTQGELLSFLDEASPAYGAARRQFTEMSRPINQMDVVQTLRDKALPAITDLNPGMARVNANSYANALRNADDVAKRATGLRSATMDSVLDPQARQTVQGIGQDMARYAQATDLARVPGSPTAQYLGAQNVIRQMLGPLGIPQSAADSMVGRIASSLLDLPFRLTQSQTEELLGRALADPRIAAQIMRTTDPRTIAEILRPFAAQAAIQMDIQE
jgi:hypothetical protein